MCLPRYPYKLLLPGSSWNVMLFCNPQRSYVEEKSLEIDIFYTDKRWGISPFGETIGGGARLEITTITGVCRLNDGLL